MCANFGILITCPSWYLELRQRLRCTYGHHQHIDNIRALELDGITQGVSVDGDEKGSKD